MFAALSDLVVSVEPAVVFTSLASLSVPGFADECEVLLTEGAATYRIQRPLPGQRILAHRVVHRAHTWPGSDIGGRQILGEHAVHTAIIAAGVAGRAGYRGVMIHRWAGRYRPTDADGGLAVFAVEYAIAAVGHQRLLTAAAPEQRDGDDVAPTVGDCARS
jgi:hypothetical protein